MLLPALSKARDKARQAVCISNLKQLGLAFFMYVEDNDGYAPPQRESYYAGGKEWSEIIIPYFVKRTGTVGIHFLFCPNFKYGRRYYITDERNSYGAHYSTIIKYPELNSPYAGPGKLVKVSRVPNTYFLFGEAVRNQIASPRNWPFNVDLDPTVPGNDSNNGWFAFNNVCFRHQNWSIANFYFLDGSARAVTKLEWVKNVGNMW
ncbi:MAG: DUF1559 domain-containing protein [Candidatus Omnitrophica bacterium]|nr:DUF1559 domain-containing protein [Candidatus Omnitrophota bacterium]